MTEKEIATMRVMFDGAITGVLDAKNYLKEVNSETLVGLIQELEVIQNMLITTRNDFKNKFPLKLK